MMMLEAVEFVRFVTGGVVHVLDRYEPIDDTDAFRQVAVCGRKGRVNVVAHVAEFPDSDLCPRCWQATSVWRRSDLSRHPVPD